MKKKKFFKWKIKTDVYSVMFMTVKTNHLNDAGLPLLWI